jgi:dolichol-phosphate mannosyltransferase
MLLSVVIPARDEEQNIGVLLVELTRVLGSEHIDYEIVVVDDGSSDGTAKAVGQCGERDKRVLLVRNTGRHGFGMAVRAGLSAATGDAVAIMMADSSDDSRDLVAYFRLIERGYDCAFGSRFVRDGKVTDYPFHKLILNRLANTFIRLLFGIPFNDITNAFKCYSREALAGMQPLISPHFNLTVEMPLKAIIRGYSYATIPITWTNRKSGLSKLKIKEMGSRYLFIVLYLWLEKHLSRGDYSRRAAREEPSTPSTADSVRDA